MKNILGLDLGVSSIGWAYVRQAEDDAEQSSIVRLGVRVNPLTVDEQLNFEKGKSITTNADRTLKRSARRNLQRYKLRRKELIDLLTENGFMTNETVLSEEGNGSTFQTYALRAKGAHERLSLEEFSRVLLMINKKRGYKSSRKVDSSEEGQLVDNMDVALELYNNQLTPGQYGWLQIEKGKKYIPDFYKSDLKAEFNKIWEMQSVHYPDILTDDFKKILDGKSKVVSKKIFLAKYQIYTLDVKRNELKETFYKLRTVALEKTLSLEELAFVVSELNGEINNSNDYLGAISDRSKTLYFNKQTVGEYLMKLLSDNPNESLRNKVFYRQDYMDEFERLWSCQSQFHQRLTPELKQEIRDVVIFYQRRLKSQKGLISFCEFENHPIEITVDGKKKTKTVGCKVAPKSSPIFQEFKIWQILNNLEVKNKKSAETRLLDEDEKKQLSKELLIKSKLSKAEALKILFPGEKNLELNYKEIEGHRTQASLYQIYQEIIYRSGHGTYDFSKMDAEHIESVVRSIFGELGIRTDILNSAVDTDVYEQQPFYQLWHLLYSYEGDNSKTGTESLLQILQDKFGFEKEYAKLISNVVLAKDYGSLSTKAMRRILPYMQEGNGYDTACVLAGYRHSKSSLTKEELEQKALKDHLDLLPKNALRNPVVEKILNQMINVINAVADEYGKPDEIHIELARELKKSAKERDELTKQINESNDNHKRIKEILQTKFGLTQVSRNDIVRYKLYEELKNRGYKTLYSNTYISPDKLFSKDFDIEHIIPQARLFDDSFSNKTLEARSINIEKSNATAYDYLQAKLDEAGIAEYVSRVEELYKSGCISKAKHNKLLMPENNIPDDFINRDLRDSQYIAKIAKEMLESYVKNVVSTTGSITDRLREDWQLVHVMQELNWDKYDRQGLTEIVENRDGQKIRRIKDWTKRNDHRHHAMDALTIAFTKRAHIQYLNNLNARSVKGSIESAIEKKELSRNNNNKLIFNPPMPIGLFRTEAKKQLSNILVSIKAKNKVVTRNVNIIKRKGGVTKKIQLTPRGQLHLETVYGSIERYVTKEEKVNASFDFEKIQRVASKKYREALQNRLQLFQNDAKKAFTGKNSLEKNPIYLDANQQDQLPLKVKLVGREKVFTIRKDITPDLKIEKVIDKGIQDILFKRLAEYKNAKDAFSNLEENPIWLNQEKGISIKRVTISGISNGIPIHAKLDKKGLQPLLDEDNRVMPCDYVATSNNHHVAMYLDEAGNIQDQMVSFMEATARVNCGLPVVDKHYKESEGWKFLFTMKQNEYFVFPNEETGFNPNDIDLLDEDNYALISPNLYRVQTMSKVRYGNSAVRDYMFRHHLETSVEKVSELKSITYKQYKSLDFVSKIVKVRINHIGKIVSVGEY